jgi:hypothetical protein
MKGLFLFPMDPNSSFSQRKQFAFFALGFKAIMYNKIVIVQLFNLDDLSFTLFLALIDCCNTLNKTITV